jgi:hypothetical protein
MEAASVTTDEPALSKAPPEVLMNEPTAPRNMVGFLIAFIRTIGEIPACLSCFTQIYIG